MNFNPRSSGFFSLSLILIIAEYISTFSSLYWLGGYLVDYFRRIEIKPQILFMEKHKSSYDKMKKEMYLIEDSLLYNSEGYLCPSGNTLDCGDVNTIFISLSKLCNNYQVPYKAKKINIKTFKNKYCYQAEYFYDFVDHSKTRSHEIYMEWISEKINKDKVERDLKISQYDNPDIELCYFKYSLRFCKVSVPDFFFKHPSYSLTNFQKVLINIDEKEGIERMADLSIAINAFELWNELYKLDMLK
jgi:hypothetical protein